MNTIEQKRATYDKWFKITLVALGALIISPIIFLVVKGIVGLVIAGLIGVIVVNFAPVVSMKLANWKVKAVVSEATKNPIETLTNLIIEKRQALDRFTEAVKQAVSARNMFEVKCREFTKQYPSRATEFNSQLVNMTKLVEQKKVALNVAISAIQEGENKLEEAKAYYSMALAAQAANKAANLDTGDIFEKLKADTAIDSVMYTVGSAFAEMEVMSAMTEPVSIENNYQGPEEFGYSIPKVKVVLP